MIEVKTVELDENILRKAKRELEMLGKQIKQMLIGFDALCDGMAASKGLDIGKIADDTEKAVYAGMAACDVLADLLREDEGDE